MRWGNGVFAPAEQHVLEQPVAWCEVDSQRFVFENSLDELLQTHDLMQVSSVEDVQRLGAEPIDDDVELHDVAPVIHPGRVLCVGLNYTDHAEEVGAELPKFPTIFTKFSNALVGPDENILLPTESTKIDWEAELCVVIGRAARRVSADDALLYALGYTVLNDISVRDWQGRTSEWFQGKNWDKTTPFGPSIVSCDSVTPQVGLAISCSVDGETRQNGNTANMIFSAADVIAYISTFMTLQPGDLIALGTPAGVGLSLHPRKWLQSGQTVTTRIEGIGTLTNRCVSDS